MSLYDKIQQTAAYIQQQVSAKPTVGIVLGSGLGGLIDIVEQATEISYAAIPNFPVATVEGHEGKLVFGQLGGRQVVMMAGRFHYYEGYSTEEITFPIRVMKALGVSTLVVSNAAGGMSPDFKIGDIMLIKDHINLFPESPLRGPNDDRLGPRFPDMSEPYSLALIELGKTIAAEQGLRVHTGTYVGLTGPAFETPAEYKYLRVIGGDTVGMSTVPEVLVAIHAGMRVFAASVVTDLGVGDHIEKITHEEVLEAANAAAPRLAALVTQLVIRM